MSELDRLRAQLAASQAREAALKKQLAASKKRSANDSDGAAAPVAKAPKVAKAKPSADLDPGEPNLKVSLRVRVTLDFRHSHVPRAARAVGYAEKLRRHLGSQVNTALVYKPKLRGRDAKFSASWPGSLEAVRAASGSFTAPPSLIVPPVAVGQGDARR